jgi:hypothetical protein
MRNKALAFLLLLTVSCTGANKPTLPQIVGATVHAADAAYGATVEVCDAKERAIIARAGSTEEQDVRDMAHVREICDKIFEAFDGARKVAPLVEQLDQIEL